MKTLSDGVASGSELIAKAAGSSGFAREHGAAARAGKDLSKLMTDPDFARPLTVVRRTESVDEHGRASFAEERLDAVGVIQPATPKELERLPEGDRHKATVAVFTAFPLRAGDEAAGIAPDWLEWQGARYEVASLDDWSAEGFCHALAQKAAS